MINIYTKFHFNKCILFKNKRPMGLIGHFSNCSLSFAIHMNVHYKNRDNKIIFNIPWSFNLINFLNSKLNYQKEISILIQQNNWANFINKYKKNWFSNSGDLKTNGPLHHFTIYVAVYMAVNRRILTPYWSLIRWTSPVFLM